ncbi:hypothetical protein JCM11251_002515 [Rhodosporidiobolus azoricus]
MMQPTKKSSEDMTSTSSAPPIANDVRPTVLKPPAVASQNMASTCPTPLVLAQKVIEDDIDVPGAAPAQPDVLSGSTDLSSLPPSFSTSYASDERPLDDPARKPRKPRVVLNGTQEEILARNAEAASPAVVEKLVQRAGHNWNNFYKNHAATQFFKDRHWTEEAWDIGGILAPGQQDENPEKGKGKAVLEVGCGTGAFIYPLLEHYPGARFVAFDFAKKAVELTKEHPLHNTSQVYAFQHDLTLPTLAVHDLLAASPPEFGDEVHSFDIVSAIFVLSALAPRHQAQAVETLVSLVKPGGFLLFRDYALHDAAQLRFHSLRSASYSTVPSLLSPRTASPADQSASPAGASSSSPQPPPPSAGPPASSPAVSCPSPGTQHAQPATDGTDLAWYKRGDNTFTYFFTAAEISSLISRAVTTLNDRSGAKKGDEAFIALEGGVEVVEREMYNRAEEWGCTRRFVHGSWKRS